MKRPSSLFGASAVALLLSAAARHEDVIQVKPLDHIIR